MKPTTGPGHTGRCSHGAYHLLFLVVKSIIITTVKRPDKYELNKPILGAM